MNTSDYQKALDNWTQWESAGDNGHDDFVRRARRNDNYYVGDQWDPVDKRTLEEEGRPALTLNMILSTVNGIIGEQLDRKVEPIFNPDDDNQSASMTAQALNKITRVIMRRNNFDDTEENVFADGVITSRGFYDVRMDFSRNLQGSIKITPEDPYEVRIDPEAKESDPTTWNRVWVGRWMTVDEVGETWGWKYAEKINKLSEARTYASRDNFEFYKRTFGQQETISHSDSEDFQRLRRVLVIEQQYFKADQMYFYVNLQTGDLRQVPYGTDKDDAQAFADEQGMGLIKRKGRRLRTMVSCDKVLLEDDWSIYRTMTVVPFFPYFRRGRPFSPVDNLIDPQNLLNKTSSQELHIVNTTANSGWVVEEDSLVDMDSEELEKRGAETGLVLTYKRGYQAPGKIAPNQIPTGIDRISQKASVTIREISGINASMLGSARADMSGVAQNLQNQRGQVQVSVLLNNLKRSRLYVLNKVLELIQDFYTDTRYFNVTGESLITGAANDEQVAVNEPQPDGSILNDVTIGNFSVEVGYRASGGTQQEKEFEEARMLRGELGVQIPDHVLVGYSQLSQRQELAEFLKNSQGFGEPTEEQQELEQMQTQHTIAMLQRELEEIDAKIETERATAQEKIAKVQTLKGYREAKAAQDELEFKREKLEKDLQLRIALAARSHSNQSSLNDKRIAGQLAMKTIDAGIQDEQKRNNPEKKPEE